MRAILENWGYFTDEQRLFLRDHVVKTWRGTRPEYRFLFAQAVYVPVDEMILRTFLRDEPGAQQELTKWLRATRK